ncbi:MAG: hypothetical protein MUE41_11370, partial [Gemmatimonadaceae bacterium]|nr:hypothetical protein [Gemmatimonadaceae bacterium]
MSHPTQPGIVIGEAPTTAPPIVATPTGVALLVGATATGPVGAPPRALRSLADVHAEFGEATPLAFAGESAPATSHVALAARLFFANGGSTLGVIRLAPGATAASVVVADADDVPVLTVSARCPGALAHRVTITLRAVD